ncbi:BBP7 family outer membrane beta-barrel protein [soil metagenome]
MFKAFIGTICVLLAGAGFASAQDFGAKLDVPKSLPPIEPINGTPCGAHSTTVPGDPFATTDHLNSTSRYWVSAEYLYFWTKDGNAPPLVTTGTPASGGVLGVPGTRTINGDNLNYGPNSGGRFNAGGWLNCGATKGFEVGYFFLNNNSQQFQVGASGAPGTAVISRPFFNVITGRQDVELVAFPGVVGGTVRTTSGSSLQGADANLLCNLCRFVPCPTSCCPTDCCPTDCLVNDRYSYRVDFLVGPRWMQLNEDLEINERLTDANGNAFTVNDRFQTRNNFYGGQVGVRGEWQRGRCFVNVLGKVALGVTHQEVLINGSTVVTPVGGQPGLQPGGLLAQPTNNGNYSRDQFSVIPEIGFNVGCQVTDRLRVYAGYTFLYWSNVVRPGDQIDPVVNPTQLTTVAGPGRLVGPARPAFQFKETDFWVQGISVGMQLNW